MVSIVPGSDLVVRRALQKDCEAIARMTAEAAREDGRPRSQLDAEILRAHAFGSHPMLEAWIVERAGGAALGCALAHTGYDIDVACATLVVNALYVAPEARGEGVARMLIGEIAERAMTLGARELTISTGIDNAAARAFFAAVGAVEQRTAVFVLGRDQVEWLAEERA